MFVIHQEIAPISKWKTTRKTDITNPVIMSLMEDDDYQAVLTCVEEIGSPEVQTRVNRFVELGGKPAGLAYLRESINATKKY